MNRYKTDYSELAVDLYDLIGLNGKKAKDFFNKYIAEDKVFQLDEYEDEYVIQLEDVDIIVKPKSK